MILVDKMECFSLSNSEIIGSVGSNNGVDFLANNGRIIDGLPCRNFHVRLSQVGSKIVI